MVATETPKAWAVKESEDSVIGACILDPRVIDQLVGKLSRRDFHDESLGDMFEFLVDMHGAGEPINDTTVLVQKMRSTRFWVHVGGAAGIGRLAQACPNASHAVYYASQIRQAADRRRLSKIAADFYQNLQDELMTPADAIGELEGKMLQSGYQSTADAIDLHGSYEMLIGRIREAMKKKHAVGVQTGLMDVDAVTGGLFPGELCICAARPSIGKTALGFQIASHAASQNRPALFVSLETEEWELAARSAAVQSNLNGAEIRAASLNDEQMEMLQRLSDEAKGVPLRIWRPVRTTVAAIRAQAKMMAATTGIAILVVDYMQLIDPEDTRDLRHEQLSKIGKALKRLANELDIPVVALAQINRKGEGERPKLSQLEGSGSMEQDANSVWLIHREDRAASEAVLFIEKNRSGSVGDVELLYDCERTVFENKIA